MLRVFGWVAIILVSIACVSIARATERATVSLQYSRADAVSRTCPEEATFRSLVAARLGYDPFATPDGTLSLTVGFRRQGAREIVGRLILVGRNGERKGDRTLRSGGSDCMELASSMALAAALAVDPEAVRAQGQPAPTSAPPSESPPPVAAPPSPAPQDPAPKDSDVAAPTKGPTVHRAVRLELSGVVPIGIVPAVRGGARAGAALEIDGASIGIDAAFLFPSSRERSYGEVTASILHGSIVPCARLAPSDRVLFYLCAVASFGVVRSDAARVSRAEPATDFFAALGPRAQIALMLSRFQGIGIAADAPVPLSRVHLTIDDAGQRREVWASSPVGFVGALTWIVRLSQSE